ncbi:MAG: sigma-70 family RNA polymerase sigma factor [Cyclobacteriaceae bacterium]
MAEFLDYSIKNLTMPGLYNDFEDERIWIERSKEDKLHFEPLYNRYYEPLYRFFMRRTDNSSLSDDLCSTTFFKALDNLNGYKWQGKPFGAWLFRIGANELNKHFRNKKQIYVIEEDKLNCVDEKIEISGKEHMELLIKLLDELPETELRMLELKYFENQSFKEMSALLEMSESAVKMRVYRLLSKLRTQMKGNDEERF